MSTGGYGLQVHAIRLATADGLFFFFFRFILFLLLVRVFFFVCLLWIGEFFLVPGVVAEVGLGYAFRVDDDFLRTGREIGLREIRRCGLESVEEQAGGLVVDLVGEQEAQPLHERDLDRVGVLEDGQVERVAGAAGLVGADLDAALLPAIVKVTELAAFESRGTTLDSVDLDVLATGNHGRKKKFGTTHNEHSSPLPPGLVESGGYAGTMMEIFDPEGAYAENIDSM